MPISSEERLCLGLWALDYIEIATHGPWRRFAKFGRAQMEGSAYYVMTGGYEMPAGGGGTILLYPDELWYSSIRETNPKFFVGKPTMDNPTFEQFWQAGWKAYQLYKDAGEPLGPSPFGSTVPARAQPKIDPDAALDELKGLK